LPEIDSFVRSGIESRLMPMARTFWGVGTLKVSAAEHTESSRRDPPARACAILSKIANFTINTKKFIAVYPTPLLNFHKDRRRRHGA
jgi:hypothetical protein